MKNEVCKSLICIWFTFIYYSQTNNLPLEFSLPAINGQYIHINNICRALINNLRAWDRIIQGLLYWIVHLIFRSSCSFILLSPFPLSKKKVAFPAFSNFGESLGLPSPHLLAIAEWGTILQLSLGKAWCGKAWSTYFFNINNTSEAQDSKQYKEISWAK